ncbi:MAG: hypothetical protein OXH09_09130, partial [Gammaproteobacteria bacterium]|nr:hypothetical protein [Gammaproteobacteria bacterium]
MRNDERQRLIGILKDGFENGGPVQGEGIVRSPLSDYTSPELLAEERNIFFRQTPLFMGLSVDLPENGSYWADSETGLPILMTRDGEGLRARTTPRASPRPDRRSPPGRRRS